MFNVDIDDILATQQGMTTIYLEKDGRHLCPISKSYAKLYAFAVGTSEKVFKCPKCNQFTEVSKK